MLRMEILAPSMQMEAQARQRLLEHWDWPVKGVEILETESLEMFSFLEDKSARN